MSNTQKSQNETDSPSQQPAAPKTRSKSVNQSENDTWQCQLCNIVFRKKTDKVLECDYCSKHSCISCLNMPVALYNHLSNPSRADIKWFCGLCQETVEKNLRHDREIEEKCRLFMEKFESRIIKLEEKADKMVTIDTVKKIVNDELKNDSAMSSTSTATKNKTSENVVTETVKEMKDRERRKTNAIFFNIPEPNTNLKVEKLAEDKQNVLNIGKEIKVEINSNNILNTTRIGKKTENSSTHRPLLVTFDSETTKREIFKNFHKLRTLTDEFESENIITITHDMTPSERQEFNNLRELAKEKEKESQGKFRYRVRGPPWAMHIKKLNPE